MTPAEIVAIGRAAYAERVGKGATTSEALEAALLAAIEAERASCAMLVESACYSRGPLLADDIWDRCERPI